MQASRPLPRTPRQDRSRKVLMRRGGGGGRGAVALPCRIKTLRLVEGHAEATAALIKTVMRALPHQDAAPRRGARCGCRSSRAAIRMGCHQAGAPSGWGAVRLGRHQAGPVVKGRLEGASLRAYEGRPQQKPFVALCPALEGASIVERRLSRPCCRQEAPCRLERREATLLPSRGALPFREARGDLAAVERRPAV